MTWPHWHDNVPRGQKGSIASSYRIRDDLRTYVIDAGGIVRFRDVYGQGLADAVDSLLKEMEPPTPVPAPGAAEPGP